mgnify:CR=1 FL=1
MAKRLTPYLLRRALDLPLADKAALIGQLRASITLPEDPAERLRYLSDKMQQVAGVSIADGARTRKMLAARNIFVFVARQEGFTQERIGAFIGRDHATVCIAEKKMREVFTYPKSYIQEINLYNRYVESL